MADAALIFEIDSSQAVGAAKALAGLNKYAAATATVAAKLESQFRKTNGQFQSQVDYIAENERDIRRLAQAYNPALDAQLRFAEAQKEVARAVQLGVIPVEQQAEVLRRLQAQYAVTGSASGGFFKVLGGGVGQVQNASYQIGDFFVQVASGQNVMMALSQQLPQLLGGFGAIGAAAGAAAAILGAAWMIWGEGAEKSRTLADANDELAASIGRLNDIAQNYSAQGIASLIEKYGQLDAQILLLIEKQREFAMNEAMALAMRAITDDASRLADFMNQVGTAITVGGSRLNGFLKDFKLTYDQAIQLRNAVNDVNAATDVLGKAKALANLTNVMKSVGMETENVYGQLVNAESQLRELYSVSNQAGWFSAALSGINAVFNRVVDTVNESLKLNLDATGTASGFAPGSRARSAPQRAPSGIGGIDWGAPDEPKRGGGSGAAGRAIEQAEKQFQSLRELLEKETLFQAAEYEKRQAQLENALDKGVLTEQKYQIMRDELRTFYFGSEYEKDALNYQMSLEQLALYLEQDYLTREQYEAKKAALGWEYANESLDLNNTWLGAELNGLSTFFGNMNQLAGGGYDKLLKAQQVFAAGSALMSALNGASKALELPYPFNIAAAGKVLATGMGFVNAIKSGGKGGATGAVGGLTPINSQPAVPQKQFNIYLNDVPAGLEDFAFGIAKQIIEMQDDGLVNINGGRR